MSAIVIGNITLDETFLLPALPLPGETLLAEGCKCDLGGKGANQAVLLARAGIPTRLVARIGGDEPAALLRWLLAQEPLDSGCLITTDAPTDRSLILLAAGGENSIVSTAGCARAMTEDDVTRAVRATDATLLLMQGNLRAAVTRQALLAARERGLATVLNAAPVDFGFTALWPLVDLAVLNRGEARQLGGTADALEAAMRIRSAGAGRVVVTLGAEGALMADANGSRAAPAMPTTVRDTTGAGDTFTAVLSAALFARHMPAATALRAAARAAAITVSRPGTLAAFPTAHELHAILAAA